MRKVFRVLAKDEEYKLEEADELYSQPDKLTPEDAVHFPLHVVEPLTAEERTHALNKIKALIKSTQDKQEQLGVRIGVAENHEYFFLLKKGCEKGWGAIFRQGRGPPGP